MIFAPATSLLSSRRRPLQLHFCLPRPSFASSASSSSLWLSSARKDPPPPPVLPSSPQPRQPTALPEPYYVFPNCSVNLITCSSNSGKTRFLDQVIRHRNNFFQDPRDICRVVYVNGNNRDFSFQHPWTQEAGSLNLEVVSLGLEEFSDYTSVLRAQDILILDDVLQLDDSIQFIVKYGAHHFGLKSVFVVTQSCLSSKLYGLINSVHQLVLLCGNTATTRLAQHLLATFFLCADTKAYLKSIVGLAEKNQDIVVLKLNAVASYRPHSKILALSRVQGLFVGEASSTSRGVPFCLAYPELGHVEAMEEQHPHVVADLPASAAAPLLEKDVFNNAFVLLPASRVRAVSDDDPDDKDAAAGNKDCVKDKQKKWNEMALFLESEIESTFPLKKWNSAKNLTRELLRCNQLCITSDYRSVVISDKPKWSFSIVDFLNAATRKAGPGETPEKLAVYRPLVQVLLKHHVPHAFFINKLMLPSSASHSAAAAASSSSTSGHYHITASGRLRRGSSSKSRRRRRERRDYY